MAMAACTYLVTDANSYLLMAKSKVVDVKRQVTIPKLELNGIVIGVRLSHNVLQSLRPAIGVSQLLILSDSEIAISWIKTRNQKGTGVFVENRVKEILTTMQKIEESGSQVQIGFIDTSKNLADCGTRGISQNEFNSHSWWTGYNLQQIRELAQNLGCIPEDDGEELPTDVQLSQVRKQEEY
ncbi:unnamed protein product [Nippostrongylus brasiliensis]|uniref:RNase H domain-containing protein n=1 Tax=Nippostrongylus brasiliensis TaxID=27835 RepID=A0A0N4YJA5_NIPBR|nr:unnamed protein product [Nippostrongylus brasiliensis]